VDPIGLHPPPYQLKKKKEKKKKGKVWNKIE
jgi:hypothetical protein